MYNIPLDLVRRFERRWAARFPGLTKEHRPEELRQHQRGSDKSKRKTPRRGIGADLSLRPSFLER
jgi:hypothetical protein